MDLPSAVPKIQHQVSHELDIGVLDVNRGAQPTNILGDIVAKDNAPHRRLSSSALAHEQHLALLLTLDRVHLDCRAVRLSISVVVD